MINIQPTIVLPKRIIVSRKEHVEYIYFIDKGTVVIHHHSEGGKMMELHEGQFFGDYQVIFDTKSNLTYQSAHDSEVVLFQLEKSKFLDVSVNKSYIFHSYAKSTKA